MGPRPDIPLEKARPGPRQPEQGRSAGKCSPGEGVSGEAPGRGLPPTCGLRLVAGPQRRRVSEEASRLRGHHSLYWGGRGCLPPRKQVCSVWGSPRSPGRKGQASAKEKEHRKGGGRGEEDGGGGRQEVGSWDHPRRPPCGYHGHGRRKAGFPCHLGLSRCDTSGPWPGVGRRRGLATEQLCAEGSQTCSRNEGWGCLHCQGQGSVPVHKASEQRFSAGSHGNHITRPQRPPLDGCVSGQRATGVFGEVSCGLLRPVCLRGPRTL